MSVESGYRNAARATTSRRTCEGVSLPAAPGTPFAAEAAKATALAAAALTPARQAVAGAAGARCLRRSRPAPPPLPARMPPPLSRNLVSDLRGLAVARAEGRWLGAAGTRT